MIISQTSLRCRVAGCSYSSQPTPQLQRLDYNSTQIYQFHTAFSARSPNSSVTKREPSVLPVSSSTFPTNKLSVPMRKKKKPLALPFAKVTTFAPSDTQIHKPSGNASTIISESFDTRTLGNESISRCDVTLSPADIPDHLERPARLLTAPIPPWARFMRALGLYRWSFFRYQGPGQYIFENVLEKKYWPEARMISNIQEIPPPKGPYQSDIYFQAKLYWGDACKEVFGTKPDSEERNISIAVDTRSPVLDTGAEISNAGIVFSRFHPLGKELLAATKVALPVRYHSHHHRFGPIFQLREIGEWQVFSPYPDRSMVATMAKPVAEEMKTLEQYIEPPGRPLTNLIDQIVREVIEANGLQRLRLKITVIHCPWEINARAKPSGDIAIYTGYIKTYPTEGALAGVITHEIAHVIAKHGWESSFCNPFLRFMKKWKIPKPIVQRYKRWLSRRQESQADHLGLRLMARAGYDVRSNLKAEEEIAATNTEHMVSWMKFHGANVLNNSIPWHLMTHPHSEQRARDMNKHMLEIEQKITRGTKGHNRIDHLLKQMAARIAPETDEIVKLVRSQAQ